MMRYVERYWSARWLERAKFRGAAMARALNRGQEPYAIHPKHGCRHRLMSINLPKRKERKP